MDLGFYELFVIDFGTRVGFLRVSCFIVIFLGVRVGFLLVGFGIGVVFGGQFHL